MVDLHELFKKEEEKSKQEVNTLWTLFYYAKFKTLYNANNEYAPLWVKLRNGDVYQIDIIVDKYDDLVYINLDDDGRAELEDYSRWNVQGKYIRSKSSYAESTDSELEIVEILEGWE